MRDLLIFLGFGFLLSVVYYFLFIKICTFFNSEKNKREYYRFRLELEYLLKKHIDREWIVFSDKFLLVYYTSKQTPTNKNIKELKAKFFNQIYVTLDRQLYKDIIKYLYAGDDSLFFLYLDRFFDSTISATFIELKENDIGIANQFLKEKLKDILSGNPGKIFEYYEENPFTKNNSDTTRS